MPHLRIRYALASLIKKLKYSPVVAMQGVRQAGKSTLARELLPKKFKNGYYVSLDSPSVLDSATQRPESFLEALSQYEPLVLDEAQKAPSIFDAVKLRVDLNRRPGQYLLLGSTEFSTLMKVRESLTGRLSRLRLFPLVTGEIAQIDLAAPTPFFIHARPRISRKNWLMFMHKGGMPALFATRAEAEYRGKAQDWISLTVERDAMQIPAKKIDPARLMRVLREIALAPEPEAGHIAKNLRISSVSVKSMIEALQTLFVVHKIDPHPAGTGKPRYYLCDPGLATQLGASFERALETSFYLEQLAKIGYHGLEGEVQFSYYRSTKGSIVHGVWEQGQDLALLKLFPAEHIDERELLILGATRVKMGEKKGRNYFVNGTAIHQRVKGVEILPWESLG